MLVPALLLSACEDRPAHDDGPVPSEVLPEASLITSHDGDDDLLSAGLGLDGLRGDTPQVADPDAPTAPELRRMAIHAQWQALIDLSPAGGFGQSWGSLTKVPGREFHARDRIEGSEHPFRILLQLPNSFDPDRPCLVAAPASGSRGIYGAVPVAGPVAFQRDCAVVHTDKGAGTDIFDFQSDTGVGLDGIRLQRSDGNLVFEPLPVSDQAPEGLVAVKHAHSADHPEARWGEKVRRSVRFARGILFAQFPDLDPESLTTIGLGLSNGGGAVLQAISGSDPDLFDGVIAVAPNIRAPDTPTLYDYATLAALYQPCMLAGAAGENWPLAGLPFLVEAGEARCESLVEAGRLEEADPGQARRVLEEAGLDEPTLSQSAILAMGDLWRSVAVIYASAYARTPADEMPCEYALVSQSSASERNYWYALSPGVAPAAGIEIHDGLAGSDDPAFAGLLCLRELLEDEDETLIESLEALQFLPGRQAPPTVVVHGLQDGLVPEAFTSRPWVAAARQAGFERLAYWTVDGAQHFDSVLATPGIQGRYGPLQAYTEAAFDSLWVYLRDEEEFPGDRSLQVDHPGPGEMPEADDLGL